MNYFDMKWRLSACRIQSGYTQKEVAEKIGVSEKTLTYWENGYTSPSMDYAQRLSELYNLPLAYMDFTKEGNSTPVRDRHVESGVTL